MLFERRSYKNINFLEDLYLDGTKYTVTLGQKCNHPEIRINGKEYRNDMGIFDVKTDSQYLRLYYYENDILSAMRCAPTLVESQKSKVESPIDSIQNITDSTLQTFDLTDI
jgi:transposase